MSRDELDAARGVIIGCALGAVAWAAAAWAVLELVRRHPSWFA